QKECYLSECLLAFQQQGISRIPRCFKEPVSVAFVGLQMISLSPLIPRIDEDDTFFTEILFVGLIKNSLEPCLIGSGTGILEHVQVGLPSSGIVPLQHIRCESHLTRDCDI